MCSRFVDLCTHLCRFCTHTNFYNTVFCKFIVYVFLKLFYLILVKSYFSVVLNCFNGGRMFSILHSSYAKATKHTAFNILDTN